LRLRGGINHRGQVAGRIRSSRFCRRCVGVPAAACRKRNDNRNRNYGSKVNGSHLSNLSSEKWGNTE
jgi:hypothetical protein